MSNDPSDRNRDKASPSASAQDDWSEPVRTAPAVMSEGDDDQLSINIEGYEGPLDVLLALARTQKLDLANISILALVEQYLSFITQAKQLKLDLAADYLVMAAWLAFLKSRLLLPRDDDPEEQISAEDMARHLSYRLMRLEAMRNRATELMARPRLNKDVYGRGWREAIEVKTNVTYTADLVDLLQAYARQRQRQVSVKVRHTIKRRRVWSIQQARKRLEDLVGLTITEWVALDSFLEHYLATPEDLRTVRAASFGATLEMAREGELEIRQDGAFGPLFMRRKEPRGDDPTTNVDLPATHESDEVK